MRKEATKEKFVRDFNALGNDVEELLHATANQGGEKLSALREKIKSSLHASKEKFSEIEDIVVDKAKQAFKPADEYVNDNPWKAVGIAAGVGLIIGLLIGRR